MFSFFLALFNTIIIRNLHLVSGSSSALNFHPPTKSAMPPRHKRGYKEDFIGVRLLDEQVEPKLTKPDATLLVDTDGALARGIAKTDIFHSKRCVVGLVHAVTPLLASMLQLLPQKAALLRLCECVWLSCLHGALFINNKTTILATLGCNCLIKPLHVRSSTDEARQCSGSQHLIQRVKDDAVNMFPLRLMVRALILLLLVETASSHSRSGTSKPADERYCDTAYECFNQSAIATRWVWARGYKSNYQAPVLQADSLRCYSSWSCARSGTANVTQRTINFATSDIDAYGSYSLAFVESVTTASKARAQVTGHGYKSLLGSTISLTKTVTCSGLLACRYSQISIKGSLVASGALSAANSVLRATPLNPSFTFSGERSGYNALLICHANQKCRIECYHNACEELFVVCSGRCNVVLSSSSTIAPIYANNSMNISGDAVDSWLDASLYKMTDTDALCELQPDEMKNDDYHAVSREEFDESNIGDNAAFCCRGGYACYGMEFSAEHNIQVICSGTVACWLATIDLPSGGDVWCEGMSSCASADLSVKDNVNCFGGISCLSATITTTGNVACAGYYSCRSSTINASSVANEDVELLFSGYWSGYGATVSIQCAASSECVIRCSGYEACKDMTYTCVGDCQVDCNQDTYCPVVLTPSPTAYPTVYWTADPTAYPSDQLLECWRGSINHLLNGAGGENGRAQGEELAVVARQSIIGKCGMLCKTTAGCVAYSWSNYNGNLCTLWDSVVASTVYETNQIMCSVRRRQGQ